MAWLFLAMLANAAYVAAMPAANVFYIGNVLLHLLLGTAGTLWLVWGARRKSRAIPLLIGGLLGAYLVVAGATSNHRSILWTHLALAAIGLALLKPRWSAGLAVLAVAAAALRFGPPPDRIRNPQTVPLAMTGEGAGPPSP